MQTLFESVAADIVKAAITQGIKNAAQLAKSCDIPINTSYALWSASRSGISWPNLQKVLDTLHLSINIKKEKK